MNRRARLALAMAVIGLTAGTGVLHAGAPTKPRRVSHPAAVQRIGDFVNDRRIDVNNLNMYVSNYGAWGYDQIHSNASGGLLFPKHTIKTVLYAGGLWMGATVHDSIRIAASVYGSEFQPGPFGGIGTKTDASIHLAYKVARYTGNPADTDHVERSAAELSADPTLDPIVHHSWSEYMRGAAPYGAPVRNYRFPNPAAPGESLDVLGPDVSGDQMIWSVYNDGDPDAHTEFNTNPMGVEVQQTTFGFNRTGALGNTLFIKLLLINKGPDTLDNMFVSMWADPDLGGFTDDLVGCDTTLSLGFCYNATNADGIYGTAPPSVGYDFFLGPKDTLGNVLPLTSFNKYINGTDPGTPDDAYAYMQGFLPGFEPLVDPTTGQETKFFHPGDPVKGTGWLDSNPADRRFLMNSGPFRMAPGDTQLVVGAVLIGQGSDRLSSITALKFYDQSAQAAFDANFNLCPPPPQPQVSVDQEHGSVTLCWDARAQLDYDPCPGYAFEGYNVYQGASVAGPWKLLGTFDIPNGITVVRDTVFDLTVGQLISDFPVAFGGDNGLQYCYTATGDAIHGGPLKDATQYYFAVTAYGVNPNAGGAKHPKVLEDAISPITVTPQRPASGTDIATAGVSSAGVQYSQLDTNKPPATNVIQVLPVSPGDIQPRCYKITFNPVDTLIAPYATWNLIDVTNPAAPETLLKNQTNISGDPNYRIFNGLQIKVIGAPSPQFQGAAYENIDPTHRRPIEGVNAGLESFGGGAGLGITFFGSTLDPSAQPDSFTTVELRFNATQKGYRYWRRELPDGSAPAVGRGYVYAGFHDVPFQAWDAVNNVQLDVGFVERAVTDDSGNLLVGQQPATHDSTWGPDASDNGGREYLFIFHRPYSDTPKPELMQDGAISAGTLPVLYAAWVKKRADSDVFDPTDKFTWTWANPATSNDVYAFCTQSLVRGSAAVAKGVGLSRIRAVPNPYYNRSRYELSQFNRIIRFVNMPEQATVRIYNLAGDLVRTLHKTDPTTSILQWDLLTERQLPVASGVYVYHVAAPGVGDLVGRLVVFMEKERLNNF